MPQWRTHPRVRILLLAAAMAFVVPIAVSTPVSAAGICATPGRDLTATLNGVINTYYPGGATAAARSSTLTLGAGTRAPPPIAPRDPPLVIQMQGAPIHST